MDANKYKEIVDNTPKENRLYNGMIAWCWRINGMLGEFLVILFLYFGYFSSEATIFMIATLIFLVVYLQQ